MKENNNMGTARNLYEKYLMNANQKVEVLLRSGRCISGVIVGYYTRDGDAPEPVIDRWHIAESAECFNESIDTFGFLRGEIIRHSDITAVVFSEDNSKIEFDR